MVRTNILPYMGHMSFRHQKILEMARKDGKVSVEGLATTFDVTLQTIRRDLSELAEQGRLERVHGGAVLPSGLHNIRYEDRRSLNSDAKSQIGLKCAARIPNGSSVFIGIGTTCESVARALVHHENLMIMTNNLNAVPILATNDSNTVLITGGRLRHADAGLVGPQAAEAARSIKFDLAVIGCSAMDATGDLFDYDLDEVAVSQTVIQASHATALVADSEKFARQAPARIAPISEVSMFCTDQGSAVQVSDWRLPSTEILFADES